MTSALSQEFFKNPSQELSQAGWSIFYHKVSYEGLRATLLVAACATIIFTSLVNPLYGALTCLVLAQRATIKSIDSLFLKSLRGSMHAADLTHQVAKKVFTHFSEVKDKSETEVQAVASAAFALSSKPLKISRAMRTAYGSKAHTLFHPVLAKAIAWKSITDENTEAVRALLRQANSKIEEAITLPAENKIARKALSKAAELRKKAYELEQHTVLPSMLRAAYYVRLLEHPDESRSFSSLGHFLSTPYITKALLQHTPSLDPHSRTIEPASFATSSGRTLTQKNIEALSLKNLADQLFS